MKEQTTLSGALDQIGQAASSADCDKRIVDDLPVGAFVRQGDVYLEKIQEKPRGLTPWGGRQVVEGATLGSRHVLSPNARAYRCPNHDRPVQRQGGTAYVGPVVECDERFLLTHPEHAEFDLPPGVYQVWYQSDPQAQARVAD